MFRGRVPACVTAIFTCAAVVLGNSDHSSAIAPVTKGAATLVPPNVCGLPFVPRLVMFSPGALSPRLPIELPRFDSLSGLPRRVARDHGNDPGMAGYCGAPTRWCGRRRTDFLPQLSAYF